MGDTSVEISQELLDQLGGTALGTLGESRRVRVALTIHLFLTRAVSIGRAAELADCGLVEFHHLLRSLDLPTVFYGPEEYAQDVETMEALKRDRRGGRGR